MARPALMQNMSAVKPSVTPYSGVKDPNFMWINADSSVVHKEVAATLRRIVMLNGPRLWQNNRFYSLYCNEDLLSAYNQTGSANELSSGANRSMRMPRQTANYIKSSADTLVGKLLQNNSRVRGLSVGGDWATYRAARKLGMMLDAEAIQGKLDREKARVCLDAVNTGSGYLYVGEEEGKVCYERWYYNEIFVDPLDAAYGCPTMLFRMRYIKRENALAYWGNTAKKRDIIMRAPAAATPAFAWTPYQAGMIAMYEAWALPIGEGTAARKGRHVLCFETGWVKDEEWTRCRFPVIQFRASELPLGWYGQAFTVNAAAAQVELNSNLTVMAKAARLGVAPYWVVSGNATVSVKQLNNMPGHVVTSTGPAPEWVTNQPFHPYSAEYNAQLKQQITDAYGVNEIESQGAAPQTRYDSDPALMRLQDAWMARHTGMLGRWTNDFHLDVAYATIEQAKEIAEREGTYPIVAKKGNRAWAMDWKDFLKLDENRYRLALGTESALSLTGPARRQEIMNMQQQGLITPEEALAQINGTADVDLVTSRITAYENNAEWIVEELIEGRIPEISGLQKLDLVLSKCREAGLAAHEYGAPPEILVNFENFVARLSVEVQKQMAMAAPQGPAGPQPQQSAAPSQGGMPNG